MSIEPASATDPNAKVDPRILRTRIHVLTVVRQLLSERSMPLTFTLVADRALVARQTLYKHWGTIENLIADSIVVTRAGTTSDYEGLDTRERAALFLSRLVTEIESGMAAVIGAIIAAAAYRPEARDALAKLDENLFTIFVESVGPASHDAFVELTAPVILLVVAGAPVSDGLQASLAERAVTLVG